MRHESWSSAWTREPRAARAPRILLYESEALRIARYAQSSLRLEIGGDLFGFYEPGGSPLVFVVSGPGPAARRDVTHFQQDPQFQVISFNHLASQFRMFYVGDWHSHHRLGLSEPSSSDDAKLLDLANKNGWPQLFSLIVQTEIPNREFGPRQEISQGDFRRDVTGGPIEKFGIWWNGFQYSFNERGQARHRVTIEFQPGESPYKTISEKINAVPAEIPHLASYVDTRESEDATPANVNHRIETASYDDEFIIGIYQKICAVLSRELRKAEMEVELEYPGGARLVAVEGDDKVACIIRSTSSTLLSVILDGVGESHTSLNVQYRQGQIDAADIRTIVELIIEQFRIPRDEKGLEKEKCESKGWPLKTPPPRGSRKRR